MDVRFQIILTITCLASFSLTPTHQQQAAPANNKCMEDVLAVLWDCVKVANLTTGNFAWFVTNGTSPKSEAPANMDTFKTQICGVQQQIAACVMQKLIPILNTTTCIGTSTTTSQVQVVQTQLTSLFGTYDLKCMHPCRATLIPDLKECYSANGLDPKLFATNTSNGAVIGSTLEQVNKFCGNKDKVMTCLKAKADACPESPQILRAISFDITAFTKYVGILCSDEKSYLTGLQCFAETTPEVDICQQKQSQAVMQLEMQANQGKWSEDRFYTSLCEITYAQITCDIAAWSKKNHEACIPAVIGLRQKLECELSAPQCKSNTKLAEDPSNPCAGKGTHAALEGTNSARSATLVNGVLLHTFLIAAIALLY
ncbi:unnamed protein product [Lymnaea stagnalis]|uniref:Uncharacterized protein n=1 Tax=Lymnaea stagnalis TaxID=6523 RepID=A0AAV2HEP0_LYMST